VSFLQSWAFVAFCVAIVSGFVNAKVTEYPYFPAAKSQLSKYVQPYFFIEGQWSEVTVCIINLFEGCKLIYQYEGTISLLIS